MSARRTPDQTREALLEAAFEEMHSQGFRGASLDSILRRTGVTKGALYHHFPNKTALGYAVVDEIVLPRAARTWQTLLDDGAEPIETLLRIGNEKAGFSCEQQIALGCPVNNLVQEMAGLDEGFRERLNRILTSWRETIETALRRGQQRNQVRPDIDAAQAAAFMVAAFEGSFGLAKCAHNPELLDTCMAGLASYVESLRPPARENTCAA